MNTIKVVIETHKIYSYIALIGHIFDECPGIRETGAAS